MFARLAIIAAAVALASAAADKRYVPTYEATVTKVRRPLVSLYTRPILTRAF